MYNEDKPWLSTMCIVTTSWCRCGDRLIKLKVNQTGLIGQGGFEGLGSGICGLTRYSIPERIEV